MAAAGRAGRPDGTLSGMIRVRKHRRGKAVVRAHLRRTENRARSKAALISDGDVDFVAHVMQAMELFHAEGIVGFAQTRSARRAVQAGLLEKVPGSDPKRPAWRPSALGRDVVRDAEAKSAAAGHGYTRFKLHESDQADRLRFEEGLRRQFEPYRAAANRAGGHMLAGTDGEYADMIVDYEKAGAQDARNVVDPNELALDLNLSWGEIAKLSDTELRAKIVALLREDASFVADEDDALTEAQRAELLQRWSIGWAIVAVQKMRQAQDEALVREREEQESVAMDLRLTRENRQRMGLPVSDEPPYVPPAQEAVPSGIDGYTFDLALEEDGWHYGAVAWSNGVGSELFDGEQAYPTREAARDAARKQLTRFLARVAVLGVA